MLILLFIYLNILSVAYRRLTSINKQLRHARPKSAAIFNFQYISFAFSNANCTFVIKTSDKIVYLVIQLTNDTRKCFS